MGLRGHHVVGQVVCVVARVLWKGFPDSLARFVVPMPRGVFRVSLLITSRHEDCQEG